MTTEEQKKLFSELKVGDRILYKAYGNFRSGIVREITKGGAIRVTDEQLGQLGFQYATTWVYTTWLQEKLEPKGETENADIT